VEKNDNEQSAIQETNLTLKDVDFGPRHRIEQYQKTEVKGWQDDFILWQKLKDFTKWLWPTVDRFPKHEKFALCSQIKQTVLSLSTQTIKFNKKRYNRKEVLNELDIQLEILRWLLQLSHELHYLSHKGYEVASIKVAEIGRILGGLYKSI
jgi:four helix bundle protein